MSSDSRRHCPYCMRELGKRELANACGCVTTCTPDHCGQTDVPMIFRLHTPRTCPAVDAHECDTGNFDRSICPEPCGSMHSYCDTCGQRQDPCAHD